MNKNLRAFVATLHAAELKLAAKGKIKPEHQRMTAAICQTPVMASTTTGAPVFVLRMFERRVRRLYRQTEGKPLTKWVPIGLIVAFIYLHWSQIVAVLSEIMAVVKWERSL